MYSRFIHHAARAFGFEISRVTLISDPVNWLTKLAQRQGVTTILDVGANEGQFARSILEAGWRNQIVSYEPLSSAHNRLTKNSRFYPNWTIAPRCAIGSSHGSVKINIAGNSQSSSLLPMLDRHVQAAPSSAYVGIEAVDVVPLDDLWPTSDQPLLLKLDVQGFEQQVLQGAKRTLERTRIIFTEMSLQPLYQGEAIFTELSAYIVGLGYRCVGIRPAYFDENTGEILQVDGTFVRE